MNNFFWNKFQLDRALMTCLIAVLLAGCMRKEKVVFEPIGFNHENYFVIDSVASLEFYDHLERVLQHYNETYERDAEGKILVEKTLYEDVDLMWNYTTKALGEKWLNVHPVQ